MRFPTATLSLALAVVGTAASGGDARGTVSAAQLGPRPFYLVDQLSEGRLKDELAACAARKQRYQASDFSIGHRGAGLQFPEHTKESYEAAARMGAGILECDVTFTADGTLVCRHAQCDLHTTTNILATPLAERCEVPFTPAVLDAEGDVQVPATARCCASALTREEFLSLEGKMDAFDPAATTERGYLDGTANWRTDLYATGGTLLTHAQSIELFRELGAGFTPELKSARAKDLANTPLADQQGYARAMIMEYVNAGVDPQRVWAQSFNVDDVLQWIAEFPEFGEQAVFLDARDVQSLASNPPGHSEFRGLKRAGINIIAPPMPVLLTVKGGEIVPSEYAKRATRAGLDIISWTTERSGRIFEDVLEGGDTFYYQTTLDTLENDGDILRTIDMLAQEVGIIGLFSDWPATTTFYANCKNTNAGKGRGLRNGERGVLRTMF